MINNIFIFGLSEALTRITPFITVLFLATVLSVDDFGFISLLLVTYEIIFIIISNNIQATTKIDFFKLKKKELLNIKKNHLVNSVLLSSPVAASLYFFLDYPVKLSILLIVFSLARTYIIYILTMLQCGKKVLDYISIVSVYVFTFLIMLLFSISEGIYSWFIAMGFAYIAQLIFAFYKYRNQPFLLVNYGVMSKPLMKASLYSGLLFMPQAIGWWMKTGVDRFLVNKFYGVEALASFSLAFQFSALLIMGVTALNLAIIPDLNSRLLSHNTKQAKKILWLGCCVILLGVVLVLGIGVFAIEYYYVGKFKSAGLLFPIFLLSIIPQCFVLLLTNVLYFTENKAFVAKSVLLVSVSQSLFNYIFIDVLGLSGLIYSALIFNSVLFFIIFYKTKKAFQVAI